jgi:hypothetical protein
MGRIATVRSTAVRSNSVVFSRSQRDLADLADLADLPCLASRGLHCGL